MTSNTPVAADGLKPEEDQGEQQFRTLAEYFGPKPVPAHAFIKAVRAAKIVRFKDDDEHLALQLMVSNDPEGSRLWALASQSNLPEAIDHWVWIAIQNRLKSELADEFDPTREASVILRDIQRGFASSIRGREKPNKRRGENLLRTGVTWLAKRRNLDAVDAISELRTIFFPEVSAASRQAKKLLMHGKPAEIKAAAAVFGLVHEKLRTSVADLHEERRQKLALQEALSGLQGEKDRTAEALRNTEEKADALRSELTTLKRKMSDEQQHWGHDMVDVKGRQNAFLRERLTPLLKDAVDALEIDPPAPQVALKRLKATLASIEDALK